MPSDDTGVNLAMAGAATGVVAAGVLVGAAAVANNSFWERAESAGTDGRRGVASGAAVELSGAGGHARERLHRLPARRGRRGGPLRNGELQNFRNASIAADTVLAIQTTACFAAAGIAWIPWAQCGSDVRDPRRVHRRGRRPDPDDDPRRTRAAELPGERPSGCDRHQRSRSPRSDGPVPGSVSV